MNKRRPHVYVIPEDDADRQIADGFALHPQVDERRIQVVPPAGGWPKVLATFTDEFISKLRDYSDAHVILLIDFDGNVEKRTTIFEQAIPDEFKTRVFVIGSKDTPEALKERVKKSFEEIGRSLAADCATGNSTLWRDEQLNHNEAYRERLFRIVRPFLLR